MLAPRCIFGLWLVVDSCAGVLTVPGGIAARYAVQSLSQLSLVRLRTASLQDCVLLLRRVTCRISLFHVSLGSIFRSHIATSSPGVFFRRLVFCVTPLRIVAHALLIVSAPFPVSLLLVALATCAVRAIEIGGISASFSRMRLPMARYAARTHTEVLVLENFKFAIDVFPGGCDALRRVPYGGAVGD